MNLWFRLLAYIFWKRDRTPLDVPDGCSTVRTRVWPNDLDTSLHVNNGRYLTLMDLGRLDWITRSGLLGPVVKNRWVPVATTITTRFVREMRLWTRFRIETRIVGWQETQAFFEHRFIFESGKRTGDLAAIAIVKAGIYDRPNKRMLTVDELFSLVGATGQTDRPLRDDLVAMIELEKRLNAVGKENA